jgi:glutamate/tyrosine decarboxylase-like PLP-dependent enzyme
VYESFKSAVLPYPTGNIHPAFWGWVMGTGTPVGMLADMLASGMNAHVAGYEQSAALVERQVLRWLTQVMGFPGEAGGVLVSGGTAANLIGLAVARHVGAGFDVRERGVRSGPELVVYGSSETHSWAPRACELLGLGRRAFHAVPASADFRIDVDRLAHAVAGDRRAGRRPIAVVGTAGTVNTGAVDDLEALAAFCRDERLWFHVDGAFGALVAFSPRLAPLLRGMERADSLAFDLHKWGYLPYGVGCALVRDASAQRATFTHSAPYLTAVRGGIAPEPLQFAELGVELSRPFRALKVWMSLRVQGARAWGASIEQNVEQARYLVARVEADPRLELLAPAPLNVVCFRYTIGRREGTDLDALNREVLVRVQERGVAVPSSTVLAGRFALRVAITNHRTRREDLDRLVEAVAAIGDELAGGDR